ncbi:MAG: uncharacterized protein QOE92_1534 [Chloroflexota bacterium]|nr:uncharacterized protein [Chloroflexota bacterium]
MAGRRLLSADGGVIVEDLEVARTSWSRFVGLMGRESLAQGGGLWIEPCNSIHMFFMRFAIDVLFLDRQNRVKKVMLNLRPWRISPIVFGARTTVELPAGTLADRSLEGSQLRVE